MASPPSRKARPKRGRPADAEPTRRPLPPSRASELLSQVVGQVDTLVQNGAVLRRQVQDTSAVADYVIAQYETWSKQMGPSEGREAALQHQVERLLGPDAGEGWHFLHPPVIRTDSEFLEYLRQCDEDSEASDTGAQSVHSDDEAEDLPHGSLLPGDHAMKETEGWVARTLLPLPFRTKEEAKELLRYFNDQHHRGTWTTSQVLRGQLVCALERLRPDPRQRPIHREALQPLRDRARGQQEAGAVAMMALRASVRALRDLEEELAVQGTRMAVVLREKERLEEQLQEATDTVEETRRRMARLAIRGPGRGPPSPKSGRGAEQAVQPEELDAPTGTVGLACVTIPRSYDGAQGVWHGREADMQTALLLFNEAVRSLLPAHRGYEAASAGDQSILVFPTPHEALEWSLELQRRLLAVAWPEALLHQPELAPQYNKALTAMLWRGPRVAIGVHYGPAGLLRQEGRFRYTGYAVALAEALAEAARPGEVVVSPEAREALMEFAPGPNGITLPARVVAPLGDRRVPLLGRAVPLYTTPAPGLEEREPVAGADPRPQGSVARGLDFRGWLEAKAAEWHRTMALVRELPPLLQSSQLPQDFAGAPNGSHVTAVRCDLYGVGRWWRAAPAFGRIALPRYVELVRSEVSHAFGWEVSCEGDALLLVF
eukprot:EG_transcript_5461